MDSSISDFGRIYYCKLWFQPKIRNKMANSVDPDETARYVRAVSSGSALFAKVSVLVYRDERVNALEILW